MQLEQGLHAIQEIPGGLRQGMLRTTFASSEQNLHWCGGMTTPDGDQTADSQMTLTLVYTLLSSKGPLLLLGGTASASFQRSVCDVGQEAFHQLSESLSVAIQLVLCPLDDGRPGKGPKRLLEAVHQLHLVCAGRYILICPREHHIGRHCTAWPKPLLQQSIRFLRACASCSRLCKKQLASAVSRLTCPLCRAKHCTLSLTAR